MTNNKSKTMRTVKKKQSCNGNNSAIKADSTQSSESKFSEEPQSNSNSSDSGQKYEIIENTPFAAVKQGETWKIVIGNMIASPKEFVSEEAAEDYVKERPWELIWTMTAWVVNNQSKFKFQTKESESWE